MYRIHYFLILSLVFLFACNPVQLINLVGNRLVEESQSLNRIGSSKAFAYSVLGDKTTASNNETIKASYQKNLSDLLNSLNKAGLINEFNLLNNAIYFVMNQSTILIKPIIDGHVDRVPVEVLEGFLYEEKGVQTRYLKLNASLDLKNAISPTIDIVLEEDSINNLFKPEFLRNIIEKSKEKGVAETKFNKLNKSDLKEAISATVINSFFNLMKEAEEKSNFFGSSLTPAESTQVNNTFGNQKDATESFNGVIMPIFNIPLELTDGDNYNQTLDLNTIQSANSANGIQTNQIKEPKEELIEIEKSTLLDSLKSIKKPEEDIIITPFEKLQTN